MNSSFFQRILVDHEELPAGLVKPIDGKLTWIVDEAAGIYIK